LIAKAVAADRVYGETTMDKELADLGVKTVAIPRKGKPSMARRAEQHRPGFRKLVKWRTGCEGRISHLKNRYGWGLVDGRERTTAWCGYGVLAHNLVKVTNLVAQKG